MQRATYDRMLQLYSCYGAREFGKLCQKLLAITYRVRFRHVVERGVQGVDVDAADGQEKYSTEVKTTVDDAIIFGDKDVAGLAARRADGYVPLLGVLRLSPLSDWLIGDAEHLAAGRLELENLRPYRRRDLEDFIRPQFAAVLEEHFDVTISGAQGALDNVLRRLGIEQPES